MLEKGGEQGARRSYLEGKVGRDVVLLNKIGKFLITIWPRLLEEYKDNVLSLALPGHYRRQRDQIPQEHVILVEHMDWTIMHEMVGSPVVSDESELLMDDMPEQNDANITWLVEESSGGDTPWEMSSVSDVSWFSV